MSRARRERGFTLPEVIIAVTILGIIAATIGAVITTAFSTTAGVQERYDASRAAKTASIHWTPDVQSAEHVNPGRVCSRGAGAAPRALVTFLRTDYASATAAEGTERLTTWWLDDTTPARVVRRSCHGSEVEHTVITSQVAGPVRVDGCEGACAAPTLVAHVTDRPASTAPREPTTYRFAITANREVR
jgi:prepilin-type N-terminal cleavage/methylation domain-containing protein